jgi:hypothetical protein
LIDSADRGCRDPDDSVLELDDSCANNYDDDFDGLIDLLDPQCAEGIETDPNAMPDLVVLGDQAFLTTPGGLPQFEVLTSNAGDPELLDGCFTGTGQRRVMRFDSVIANVGTGVLNITDNSAHPDIWLIGGFGDRRFKGWTRFELLTDLGVAIATGGKSSFCMVNLIEVTPDSPVTLGANCVGLDVGWADVYNSGLACQFIDITGVPAGDYTLRITTNFRHEVPELNYENNSADVAVSIPPP